MRHTLVAMLLIGLINLSPIYGQTISVSVTDFRMLRTELLISKQLLENSTSEIETLQLNLRQASISRETLELRIEELEQSLDNSGENLQEAERRLRDSDSKIDDLETRLTEALGQQRELQNRINSLENLLSELYTSLTDTEIDVTESGDRILSDIQELVAGYERRIRLYKVLSGVLGGLLLLGGSYGLLSGM